MGLLPQKTLKETLQDLIWSFRKQAFPIAVLSTRESFRKGVCAWSVQVASIYPTNLCTFTTFPGNVLHIH